MRAFSFILAAAVLASAPMALAQTEAPAANAAAQAAPVYTPIEPVGPNEEVTAPVVEAAVAAEEPAAEAAQAEPELVCCTVIARTESRLRSARERVCRTQAQWDAIETARSRNGRAGPNNN